MSDQNFASGGLQSKRLFIEHIAARLDEMESGRTRLKPLAYRAQAKMLREALRAFPRNRLDALIAAPQAALSQAIYNRCFEAGGLLCEAPSGAAARAIRLEADRLLTRLRRAR